MGRKTNGTSPNGATGCADEPYTYGFRCQDGMGRPVRGEVVFRRSEDGVPVGKLIVRTELGHSVVFGPNDLDQVEHVRSALAVGMQMLQEYRAARGWS